MDACPSVYGIDQRLLVELVVFLAYSVLEWWFGKTPKTEAGSLISFLGKGILAWMKKWMSKN